MKKAIIITRFSTDLQRDALARDQERECRKLAGRLDADVVEVVNDPETSGSIDDRPGLNRARELIRRGEANLIIAEGIDRISRDQEYIARFHKLCQHHGATIHTVQEGEVSELHVGLKGTMNALFLKDFKVKIRRGIVGQVLAGKSSGASHYGYKRILTDDGTLLEINPEEAKWVRWIFERYAEGWSCRAIARELNRLGVKSPSGDRWGHTSVYADRRGRGFLANELYAGRMIYGKTRMVRDPDRPEKRLWQPMPEEQWTVVDVPHLRIVPEDVWQKVRERRAANFKKSESWAIVPARNADGSLGRRRVGPSGSAKYLLSGILKCGVCGGSMALATTSYTYIRGQNKKVSSKHANYHRCTANHSKGPLACTNNLKIRRDIAEARIKETIREQLFDAIETARFKETLQVQLLTSGKDAPDEAQLLRKRDRELDRQRGNILAAIKDGVWTATTGDELRRLEAEQRDVQSRLAGIEASANRSLAKGLPALLDGAGDVIADLEALEKKDVHLARRHLASLLGGVVHVYPNPGGNVVAELRGHLLGLLDVLDALGRFHVSMNRAHRRLPEFTALLRRMRELFDADPEALARENALAVAYVRGSVPLGIKAVGSGGPLHHFPPRLKRSLSG